MRDNEILSLLRKRAEALKAVSLFFEERGFLRVETPILTPYCNPDDNVVNVKATFKDFFSKRHSWFLHTSPEFFMKRLIWYGAERIYQITKVFRDGEITPLHEIEFTMVEWYRVSGNYEDGMEETHSLVKSVAEAVGSELELERAERVYIGELFREFAGVKDLLDEEEVKRKAGRETYEEAFFQLLVERVEPELKKFKNPLFVYGYPPPFSAMAKVRDGRAERFELYIGGVEIANGYTELTKEEEYREKFLKAGSCAVDRGFLELLKKRELPECEGVALGFDRLIMVLLGKREIGDVIPFPTSLLIRETSS